MSFLKLHKVVTYLLASFGLFGLTMSGAMPVSTSVLIGLAVIASWFVEGNILDHPRYSAVWNIVLVLALAIQIVRGVAGESILPLGVEFAALLQVSRLMYRRRAVDHQQITVLAFLHLIAATVLSTGLEYALTFLGYVIVVPWMLVLTHLRSSIERHHGRGDPNKGRAAELLRSKSIAGPKMLLATASLSVPLFLVTATFFLAFPRIGMGFLSFGSNQGRAVAGFGKDVQLGGFGTIQDDPTVVLRVRPKGSTGHSATYRMRGTSFDHYEDGRWSRSAENPTTLVPMGMDYFALKRAKQGNRTLEVIMDPIDEPVFFIPEGAVGFRIAPNVRNGFPEPRRIVRARGLDVRYLDGDGREIFYTVYTDGTSSVPAPALKDHERSMYLQLPEQHDDIAALTNTLLAPIAGKSEHRKADFIERWLQQDGGFSYTLQQADPQDADPLSLFLFGSKAGHCEYFSTAMAVMLRTAGIPSRNVTGFVGGQLNPYGGYYEIKQGDAHSWVEAYVDGVWTRYDPTPTATRSAPKDDSILQTLRQMIDALRMQWSDRVVDYNLRDQVRAFQSMRRWFSSWTSKSADNNADLSDVDQSLTRKSIPAAAIVFVILLLFAALAAFFWFARTKREVGAVALMNKLDKKLDSLGLARPTHRTVSEHTSRIQHLQSLNDESLETLQVITDLYLHDRYNDTPITTKRLRVLSGRIRNMRTIE